MVLPPFACKVVLPLYHRYYNVYGLKSLSRLCNVPCKVIVRLLCLVRLEVKEIVKKGYCLILLNNSRCIVFSMLASVLTFFSVPCCLFGSLACKYYNVPCFIVCQACKLWYCFSKCCCICAMCLVVYTKQVWCVCPIVESVACLLKALKPCKCAGQSVQSMTCVLLCSNRLYCLVWYEYPSFMFDVLRVAANVVFSRLWYFFQYHIIDKERKPLCEISTFCLGLCWCVLCHFKFAYQVVSRLHFVVDVSVHD